MCRFVRWNGLLQQNPVRLKMQLLALFVR